MKEIIVGAVDLEEALYLLRNNNSKLDNKGFIDDNLNA